MRRYSWPLLFALPILAACASDETAELDGGEVVYGDPSPEQLAAHTESSVAYGEEGAVGSAGPGGELGAYGGDGSVAAQAPAAYPAGSPAPTYPQGSYPQGSYPQGSYPQGSYPQGSTPPVITSGPAVPVTYAPATAVHVENAFVWYKPWTWRNRRPSGRMASWRARNQQAAANAQAQREASQAQWRHNSEALHAENAARSQAWHAENAARARAVQDANARHAAEARARMAPGG